MLYIKNFSKEYSKGKRVVDNISLKVNKGEIFGFIGHNGAGKTTTIKSIVGILEFNEGDILIDNKSIKKNPIECKKVMAYIPDNLDLYDALTGIQYLSFIADIYKVSKEQRENLIRYYGDKFELTKYLGDLISSYSHGMKQKLLIISVLLHNPKNWILDEPMTGLDPKAAYTLKKLMKEHSLKGNTVFFSTHVLEVAEKICDKIAVIDKGKIIFVGTCEELKEKSKTNSSLEESFLKIIEG